jgi:hypothetical protein
MFDIYVVRYTSKFDLYDGTNVHPYTIKKGYD